MVSMDIKPEADDAGDSRPCLYLNDDQCEALGITTPPQPGQVFLIQAKAVVSRVTAEAEEADEVATEGNTPDVYLTLCITDMDMTAQAADMASRLYGS